MVLEKKNGNLYNGGMKNFSLQWPEKRLAVALVLFTGLVYFLYFPVSYDFDGTVFSHFLRHALVKSDLTAAHQVQHPLYMPLNYLLYKVLQGTVGYHVLEYFHFQLFSLIFGLLMLWTVYKILAAVVETTYLPLLGTALVAFCYGNWYYSVEAEVHMPGLFFTAAGFYLLFFKPRKPRPGPGTGWGRELAAMACFTLALGFHMTNGLVVPALFLIFLLEKRPFKWIVMFFLFFGLMMAGGFLLFLLLSGIDPGAVYRPLVSGKDVFTGYRISYWAPLSLVSLWGSVKSVAHGIVTPAAGWLKYTGLLFAAAATGVAALGAWKKHKKQQPLKEYRVLMAWLLPYFVFFTFWDHRNPEFKLHVVLPLVLLGVLALEKLTRFPRIIVTAAVTVVFLLNFYFYMLPANDFENNPNYRVAEAIGRATPHSALILIGGTGSDLANHNKIYISYFGPRKTLILDWMLGRGMTLQEVKKRLQLEQTGGADIYLFSEMLREGPVLTKIFKNHHLTPETYRAFRDGFRFTATIPLPGGYYLKKIN